MFHNNNNLKENNKTTCKFNTNILTTILSIDVNITH